METRVETSSSVRTRGWLSLGTSLVLVSIGALLCSMTVEVCAIPKVQVVAADYGPAVEDPLIVSFCNDSENVYTIVLECTAKSHSLNWIIDRKNVSSTCHHHRNSCIPKDMSGFTFLFISGEKLNDANNNILYVSQLRVNTSTLANLTGEIIVTCQTINGTRVLIKVPDGNQPVILNVFRGKDMDELIAIWTSNNSDIVNISLTLKSNSHNIEPVNVDYYKKWASIMVPDVEADYIIRVTEHNKCGQDFSSEEYYYTGLHSTGPHMSSGATFIIIFALLVIYYAN